MTRTQRTEAKRKIAEFVLSEIENSTQAGISPVTGGEFKELSKKYAAIKKKIVGHKHPDLHLNNTMISSIKATFNERAINFKITEKTEKKKAFNHITGDSKNMPKRPFLPNDEVKTGKNAKFSSEINKGILEILKEVNGR
jgi:hypothetical protein